MASLSENEPLAGPFKYSAFQAVPPFPHQAPVSTYVSQERQHHWARVSQPSNKRKRDAFEENVQDDTPQQQEEKRGRNTIVIHPGSRFLRIGRATDIFPVSVPHVIARRMKGKVEPKPYVETIRRPWSEGKQPEDDAWEFDDLPEECKEMTAAQLEEYLIGKEHLFGEDDESKGRFIAFRHTFKERMKLFGLRPQPNAKESCTTFHRSQVPEIISEHNDAQKVSWITNPPASIQHYVGKDVLLLADPPSQGFDIRWPIRGINLNTSDGLSRRAVLDDLDTIWTVVLEAELYVRRADFKNFNVVLVVPDMGNRLYIRDLVNLLLVQMNFKQVAVHQEAVCTGYGSQMTFGCIVDAGAVKTTICCLEDGLVVPDSRVVLSTAGDDITDLLYVLVRQTGFLQRELDLSKLYLWNLMEDLKQAVCSCSVASVGPRILDVTIRAPGVETTKHKLKLYDEQCLAANVLFETNVVAFWRKRALWQSKSNPDIQEELSNAPIDEITYVMHLSTRHNMPPPKPVAAPGEEPAAGLEKGAQEEKMEVDQPDTKPTEEQAKESSDTTRGKAPKRTKAVNLRQESPPISEGPLDNLPGGFPIDVPFEASKLPLDVAIFNSTRGLKTHEQSKRYLQNVLIVGGGALLQDLAPALEQRLLAIAQPFWNYTVESCQIIPPPRDLDPRLVAWKGASIMARLESAEEFWISKTDWDMLGMRAFRDRSLFL